MSSSKPLKDSLESLLVLRSQIYTIEYIIDLEEFLEEEDADEV